MKRLLRVVGKLKALCLKIITIGKLNDRLPINEDKYHCFTCKKVYSPQNFNDHWPNCENIDEIEIEKLQDAGSSKSTSASTAEDITKMADLEKQLTGTLQEFFCIDEKKNSATCKYCSTAVTINFRSMIEHMKDQHDKVSDDKPKSDHDSEQASEQKTGGSDEQLKKLEKYLALTHIDHGKRRSELAKFGRQHSMKLNFNGSKGWCLVCDRYIPAHMNNFKEHIKGTHHIGNLELQGKKTEKVGPKDYKTRSILQCTIKYAPQEHEFWINDEYSVDVYSYFLLHQIQDDPHFKKTKCFACNELFPQGQELKHCENPKHKNNFLAAKFIEKKAVGFLREIHPSFYHCGLCNLTFPSLDILQHHVISLNHLILQDQKKNALWPTMKINTKTDDVYKKLLYCSFRNI